MYERKLRCKEELIVPESFLSLPERVRLVLFPDSGTGLEPLLGRFIFHSSSKGTVCPWIRGRWVLRTHRTRRSGTPRPVLGRNADRMTLILWGGRGC